MKDDQLYLIHISECIARIEDFISEGEKQFFSDVKTQDAVLRNLQTLAESTKRISQKLKDNYPEINWSAISGFRNVVVHDYLGVDLEQIWEIIQRDLPELKEKIKKLAKDIG